MSEAQRLAARRALDDLGLPADRVLLDGNWDFVGDGTSQMLVKGDARCLSIAAASILAKVTRDRIMRAEAEHHPYWAFELNKGYPCPKHKVALQGVGPVRHPPAQLGVHGPPVVGGRAPVRASAAHRSRAAQPAVALLTVAEPCSPTSGARCAARSTDLRQAQLAATAWPVVAGDLARLAVAVERGDADLVRASLVPDLAGHLRGEGARPPGRRRQAGRRSSWPPSRPAPCPLVGAVSAAILIVIGYLLGGWLVAAGTERVRAVHLRGGPRRHPHHQGPPRAPPRARAWPPPWSRPSRRRPWSPTPSPASKGWCRWRPPGTAW